MILRRVLLVSTLLCTVALAQDGVTLPTKEKFHLYLLVGQSNMAGRGEVEEEDKKPHPRVLTLTKDGTWAPAVDPIHFDKKGAGVGPGRTFGVVMAEADPEVVIGLIPAACGGSPISVWVPGRMWSQTNSFPWDDAIRRVRLALESGTFKGILWHQGESDCTDKSAPLHAEKLKSLIERFRSELKAPMVPFIIGQLGKFDAAEWPEPRRQVDAAQRAVAQEVPHCASGRRACRFL